MAHTLPAICKRLLTCLALIAGQFALAAPPARLVDASAACLQELQAALDQLAESKVVLDLSVWQQQSEVVVEKRGARDERGRRRDGRELRGPLRFQLQVENDQCWLTLANKPRLALPQCTCSQ